MATAGVGIREPGIGNRKAGIGIGDSGFGNGQTPPDAESRMPNPAVAGKAECGVVAAATKLRAECRVKN